MMIPKNQWGVFVRMPKSLLGEFFDRYRYNSFWAFASSKEEAERLAKIARDKTSYPAFIIEGSITHSP